MEGAAEHLWKLAYDLRSHEQMEQERSAQPSVCRIETEGIIQINVEVVCLDSTSVKVHPDGTGALKKRKTDDRKITRRTHHEDSYGYRT